MSTLSHEAIPHAAIRPWCGVVGRCLTSNDILFRLGSPRLAAIIANPLAGDDFYTAGKSPQDLIQLGSAVHLYSWRPVQYLEYRLFDTLLLPFGKPFVFTVLPKLIGGLFLSVAATPQARSASRCGFPIRANETSRYRLSRSALSITMAALRSAVLRCYRQRYRKTSRTLRLVLLKGANWGLVLGSLPGQETEAPKRQEDHERKRHDNKPHLHQSCPRENSQSPQLHCSSYRQRRSQSGLDAAGP